MEMHNVPLRSIKVDPLAHELATSEGNRPYLDCVSGSSYGLKRTSYDLPCGLSQLFSLAKILAAIPSEPLSISPFALAPFSGVKLPI
jgi:hypothetical protein